MIAIVKCGSGNVGAVANIYKKLKIDHCITNNFTELNNADRYVLPGVGAFDTTMQNLKNSGIADLLHEQVLIKKKNILGICVGMQMLAESSEEGNCRGLGWIHGRVQKIDQSSLSEAPHLPHMGWNSITTTVPDHPLFEGVNFSVGFYFLHSYYFNASRCEDILATVQYGNNFACAVARDNIIGLQFHPEKSHSNGMAIFRNFASL